MIPRALVGDPFGLVVIDWSLLVRRAWHIKLIDGTAAMVLGQLWQIIADPMPPSIAIAVDPERVDPDTGACVRRWTWRDQATAHLSQKERYKANRIPKPRELVAIERNMFRVIKALRVPFLLPANPGEEQTYDADDAIAAAVARCRLENRSVAIVSEDKDLLQLVTTEDPMVPKVVRWWPFLSRDRLDDGEPEEYDNAAVRRRFDVEPSQIRDYLAIMGDTGDNVPGVNGIGSAGAAKLLFDHGSLDAAIACATAKCDQLKREAAKTTAHDLPCQDCGRHVGAPCVNANGVELKRSHASRRDAAAQIRAAFEPLTRPESLLLEQQAEALASRDLVKLWDEEPIAWNPDRQMVGGFDLPALREALRGFGFTRMADDLPSFPKAPFGWRAA
jgi:5'-3' exonuclease